MRTHPPFSAQPSTFHENYSAYLSTFQCVPIHLSVRSHPPFMKITVRTYPPFSAYPSTFHFEATKNNTYLNEIIDKKAGTMFAE
ncbi:hypothetical protein GXS19_004651 [Salmonella enterica]|nr:hypothetical protein [Salmonella enterica]EDG5758647.1 hypothetical protein [Salmonella enterica subsp. enterica serovar Heidelberg]EBM4683091.1 hypothetical protein [Salmonella enterica]EBP4256953.1 hypothetical protein [Salmonella enterica]ECC8134351.1 hypothetical protein [Salmonella enterica]